MEFIYSLESFARKTTDVDELDQSIVGDLTKVEEHLLKTQEIMTVRGKVSSLVENKGTDF